MSEPVDLFALSRNPERLSSLLIAISKKVRILSGLKLAELGLQNCEDEIVLALRDGRVASVTSLSSELAVRFPLMLKAIEKLVERGLVSRLAGPLVKLSDRGMALVPRVRSFQAELGAQLARALGTERAARMAHDLAELETVLKQTMRGI